MLRAILQGKAGRLAAGEDDHSWRDLFRQREDLLTSVFFSRIPYLSPESITNILAILISNPSSEALGPLQEITFWPKLRGTAARRFVEPDVLMEFENSTIVVEVKPPRGSGQHLPQWRSEIEALILDQKRVRLTDEGRPIRFVALGRNVPEWREWKRRLEIDFSETKLQVHAVEWQEVYAGVMDMLCTSAARDKAVFSDWIEAFSLYGLVTPARPFSELFQIQPVVFGGWERLFDQYSSPINLADWAPVCDFADKTTFKVSKWR